MKPQSPRRIIHESGQGIDLVRVIMAPTIWALHFLTVYVAGAVWCAKAGREASLEPVRWLTLAATLGALGGIVLIFRGLWRVRTPGDFQRNPNFSGNEPEDRHRLLSHVGITLCGLSVVAILFTTFPAIMVDTCR
jgi:hypothetical protein